MVFVENKEEKEPWRNWIPLRTRSMTDFLKNGLRSIGSFLFFSMNIKSLVAAGCSAALLSVTAGSALAQFSAPSGAGDTTAQVRKILDQVKAIGIVDGKAIAGKTKEACDVLAKADPLLKMVNDSEVKQTASELKKILECK